ncbi:conjugative transposon mobilization protein BF0132 [Aquipluma nitroreducens]|uniref:Conjugative transposon mobilization protein BF0132 n=1 Tax=Aquipluma nitroreducens TaxID=2010828 RepID=A0A5K7S3H9_9BACT|nr:conjugal transfer protein MobB [Aquipluma nitroreducens]BBE16121.1 conjugative transposon mobilization protein BF0132 [Aquipluma nitroreducens]
MVTKISSGSSLYGVLAYNQIKVDDQKASVLFTNRMIEPQDGTYDLSICMRSFEAYLLANIKTEKPILHISINPDPKDILTDDQLSSIAQEYMQKMGYGDQPFIVYKHEDIDRKHIHVVSLRVDETGKSIKDSFEHRRSMTACRELEQKYGLVPADQKQRQESAALKAVDYEKGDIKHQVANVIRPVAQEYHFLSLKEFKALLSFYNVHVEEVRGEIKGKPYRGLVYSALNDHGEKVGNPFKSSLFGKSVGIESLEKRIEKSVEIIKQKGLKERSKRFITSALKSHPDRISFEKELTKNGISVLFRENENGRIYGVTFIDHEQKVVFNGSRLGKEFSANVFNERFGGDLATSKNYKADLNTLPDKEHQTAKSENSPSSRGWIEDRIESAGSLFSIFLPESDGHTGDNHPIGRRRKKKKRRFGRQL